MKGSIVMLIDEVEVRKMLIEIFKKFKSEYYIDPKPFMVTLANMWGAEIPDNEMSRIKYNLMLDILEAMYGKNYKW
jgi:hypothetical protein